MEEFILPEKWSIKVTKENSLIVGKYFKKASNIYKNWPVGWGWADFLNSHNINNETPLNSMHNSFSSSDPKYLEITTEQFEKYVLNKPDVNIQPKEDLELNQIIIKLLS